MAGQGSVRGCSVRNSSVRGDSGMGRRGQCTRSQPVTENGQRDDGKRAFQGCKPSRKRKPSSRTGLQQGREAYRHDKTHPHPPPSRQRIHVISTPGFFHPLGRQRFPPVTTNFSSRQQPVPPNHLYVRVLVFVLPLLLRSKDAARRVLRRPGREAMLRGAKAMLRRAGVLQRNRGMRVRSR